MKNKKWYIIIFIILLILSNMATLILSNGMSIAVGDKVIVQTKDSNTAEYITKLLNLKNEILSSYYQDVDEDELLEGALIGMFQAVGDPYTVYYDEDQFQSYMEQIQGTYVGIGVVVTMDDNNIVTVVSPIEGSPGKKAGLVSGDKIVKVNNEEIIGLNLTEVVAKIKGDQGTEVTLTIQREGFDELIEKTLIREEIVMKSVNSEVLDGDLGYLTITQFENYTSKEFNENLDKLLDENIKGLIVDVRDNPGGRMDTVVEIVDRLMGESVIVYTEDKAGNKDYKYSDEKNKLDLPIVVLINGGSASASEIFAGALQDTNSATIVGTTSFGKGIVQRMSDLGDGTGYKVTVSEYFTPNGRNIHDKGIEPDVEIEMPLDLKYESDYSLEKDVQLNRAIEVLKDKIG
ncbi:MAG: S41 family peptidase [Eubacteriaceae bacterium]